MQYGLAGDIAHSFLGREIHAKQTIRYAMGFCPSGLLCGRLGRCPSVRHPVIRMSRRKMLKRETCDFVQAIVYKNTPRVLPNMVDGDVVENMLHCQVLNDVRRAKVKRIMKGKG